MILPVPVKPWVRHLLIQQYGKEPFEFRSNSDIGSILLLAVADADTLRLSVDDLTEETQEELAQAFDFKDCQVVRFKLGGKFKDGVIIADMLPLMANALEGYFKTYVKGFSIGYRVLLNSELASAKVLYQLFNFNEDIIKLDNLIKIIQREGKEMRDPLYGQYRPKRNRVNMS
jgi:hypothetical protein